MDGLKNGIALIVAVVAIVAAGLLITFLLGKVGDEQWDRYVYLLSGVEAVAFAAAGWLFGKEVHREQAETAEKARTEAEKAKDEAVATAADEHRRGVETARNAVLAADSSASALASTGGSTGADLARDSIRAIVQSSYPDELGTI